MFKHSINSRFIKKFNFNPGLAGYFQIAVETFITDSSGHPVNVAQTLSNHLALHNMFNWELGLSQAKVTLVSVASNTIGEVINDLDTTIQKAKLFAQQLGLVLQFSPVIAQYSNTQSVNTRDNQKLWLHMNTTQKNLHFLTAATSIRIFTRDIDHAILIRDELANQQTRILGLNITQASQHRQELIDMAGYAHFGPVRNVTTFHSVAVEQGFNIYPILCNWYTRINPEGYVEFRCLDSTDNVTHIFTIFEFIKIILTEASNHW